MKAGLVQIQIAEQPPAVDQVGDAPGAREGLAGDGRQVAQLGARHLAENLVGGQVALEQVLVGEVLHLAHAVGDHHLLEGVVDVRVARHRQPGRQTRAGAEQIQPLARLQSVEHQGADRLLGH